MTSTLTNSTDSTNPAKAAAVDLYLGELEADLVFCTDPCSQRSAFDDRVKRLARGFVATETVPNQTTGCRMAARREDDIIVAALEAFSNESARESRYEISATRVVRFDRPVSA